MHALCTASIRWDCAFSTSGLQAMVERKEEKQWRRKPLQILELYYGALQSGANLKDSRQLKCSRA